ncbi:RrF2 family transcriptional regulator [Lactiplantibacillus fabifermentans]|uniref:Transcription regulator n=2 Tax=Lactiplantibacillus fabifermentans TaxID=483011 RepID=A0A0R2NXU5_9LACO|nr:Rrf2 family transcriptional regulator [Lactiplantibacillus fabifermentans]ETY72746.1 Rrf2 family transcriptional regulator [Lactiplantibacillus fabifermentans T30PCM01]KRO29506.1 transcription regulator [Lactiplantibacillus fabifermentans DSM 21115]
MKLDFSVAVHSLLYLDAHRPNKVSSRELAQSLHLNPVMIRNILSVLHKNGYLIGTVGKNGGYQLEKALAEMNLGDLYDLTIPPTLSYARFITGHSQTDDEVQSSEIAANISETLTDLFTVADRQYRAYYHQFTMADLQADIQHHGHFLAKEHDLES